VEWSVQTSRLVIRRLHATNDDLHLIAMPRGEEESAQRS
jgi:hypothetical protein